MANQIPGSRYMNPFFKVPMVQTVVCTKAVYCIPPVDQHRDNFKLECDMPLLGQKTPCAQWFENLPLCDRRLAKELGEDYVDGDGWI